jgi:hypothetical protein
VPAIRRISHLPVIVDPSHGTGTAYMVTPLARAGVAVAADGLMIEVHNRPELALSDSAQALTPSQYLELVGEVRAIHELVCLSHGPASRLCVNESDRPQVRTRTDASCGEPSGYNCHEMDLIPGSAKHAPVD